MSFCSLHNVLKLPHLDSSNPLAIVQHQSPIHLVATTSTMHDNPTSYHLWCCFTDEPEVYFSVQVPKTATADDLKGAIKNRNEHTLQGIDACLLQLWKVSIADEDLDTKLEQIRHPEMIEDSIKLQLLHPVFLDPPTPQHVHIIVQHPPGEWC